MNDCIQSLDANVDQLRILVLGRLPKHFGTNNSKTAAAIQTLAGQLSTIRYHHQLGSYDRMALEATCLASIQLPKVIRRVDPETVEECEADRQRARSSCRS